jgi:hypothetical protein
VALLAVVEIKFTSLVNVARLRHIQNLCGFSTPTAMGESFIMTLYIHIYHSRCFGIRESHGKSPFKLAVKLSLELWLWLCFSKFEVINCVIV